MGAAGVGKTTLMKALQELEERDEMDVDEGDSNVNERTAGVDVVNANVRSCGRLSFWDFGGQDNFHRTHALFFSAINTLFLLLLSLVSDEAYLEAVARYWLAFIKSSQTGNTPITVLFVGSRGDKAKGLPLKRVVRKLRQLFGESLNIVEKVFILKCHLPAMQELREYIGQVKTEFLKVSQLFWENAVPGSHLSSCLLVCLNMPALCLFLIPGWLASLSICPSSRLCILSVCLCVMYYVCLCLIDEWREGLDRYMDVSIYVGLFVCCS